MVMASFGKLADNLSRLAQVPSQISQTVANKINEQFTKQFSTGTDPYGKSWKPLKESTIRRKHGDNRVLLDTDKMYESTVAVPMRGAGIELRTTGYAGYHQAGTRYMVARPVLPGRSDLPLAWQRIIREALEAAVGKAVG